MTIHFSSKPEDIVEFVDWYYKNHKEGKKQVQKAILVATSLLVVTFLVLYLLFPAAARPYILAEGVIGFFVLVFFLRQRIISETRKQILKIYTSPENSSYFGEQTLELKEDGLLLIAPVSNSLIQWSAIKEITVTPTHAYITSVPAPAISIPRAQVGNSDFDAFFAEAQRLHAQATGNKTAIPLPAR